jgi:hypothetical protein
MNIPGIYPFTVIHSSPFTSAFMTTFYLKSQILRTSGESNVKKKFSVEEMFEKISKTVEL